MGQVGQAGQGVHHQRSLAARLLPPAAGADRRTARAPALRRRPARCAAATVLWRTWPSVEGVASLGRALEVPKKLSRAAGLLLALPRAAGDAGVGLRPLLGRPGRLGAVTRHRAQIAGRGHQ